MNNLDRAVNIGIKIAGTEKAIKIAIAGLSSANKGNPFWDKRSAMQTINQLRNQLRKLEGIWCLEMALK